MTHDVMRTKKAIDAMTIARARQVVNHGFTSKGDDRYEMGELACAASCYAAGGGEYDVKSKLWPFADSWWKPSPDEEPQNRKRDIEKAGALLMAEWERLDRLQEKRADEEAN